MGSIMERRGTDPFEIPVCNTDPVEIFQTLGCPVQLSSYFSKGNSVGE